jgi:hypothetical protein
MRLLASLTITALFISLHGVPAHAAAAPAPDIEARVLALSEQLDAVKAELKQLKAEQQQARTAAGAAPPEIMPAVATATPAAPPAFAAATGLSWFGYGELNYAHPTQNSARTTADVARYVLGAGYQFNDKTRFVSELELEHAVSSAADPGEIEVEQAYIERQLTNDVFVKMGLFLIPTGLLNENHEPTRYYGVFRNNVETAIIPTTWREGGVSVQGRTESGLRWDAGVGTGFDLAKWDTTSVDGRGSPLASIHQELAQAQARDLSGFLALNYTGAPGLRLGGSIFSGGAAQGQPGIGASQVTLWEGHARWSPGQWDLSALYARGHISDTAALNLLALGDPTPIPEDFFGWYLESAYRLIDRGEWSLTPFLRYERFNTASGFATLPPGLTPATTADSQVFTGGVNFVIVPGVVIKADYLNFRRSTSDNRFDLGLGYQF